MYGKDKNGTIIFSTIQIGKYPMLNSNYLTSVYIHINIFGRL